MRSYWQWLCSSLSLMVLACRNKIVRITQQSRTACLYQKIMAGYRNVDPSAVCFHYDKQKDIIEVEWKSGLNFQVYYNPKRAAYDSSQTKFLTSIQEQHPDSCPFCQLPEKQKLCLEENSLMDINGRYYQIAVNKNPYFRTHINLISYDRQPQYLTEERLLDLFTFQKALGPSFAGHYHGINGGATILHFHVQFRRDLTPLWRHLASGNVSLKNPENNQGVVKSELNNWPFALGIYRSSDIVSLTKALWQEIKTLFVQKIPHNLDWYMDNNDLLTVAVDKINLSAFLVEGKIRKIPLIYSAVAKTGKIMATTEGFQIFQTNKKQYIEQVDQFLTDAGINSSRS